ncbi:MAG: tRNA lysidine(34) synthetase TilS [Ginsengibacter sp.]
MSLLKGFIQYIETNNLFQKSDPLLLAVSGGVDSVVLAELCHQAGYSFSIAHCNFHLRDEESNRDEAFVHKLGEKYKVPVYVKSFDTELFASQNKMSIQVAARELRYTWFRQLSAEIADKVPGESEMDSSSRPLKIVTAHHANDNIETLLMNFFKGTGIRGLQGILPKQENLIRPLLFASKNEIVQFSEESFLSFVEDSSNLSNKYTRNYFRNEWLPSVEKIFPKVEENLVHNIERFREIEILYNQSIALHRKKLIEYRGKEVHIPVLKLVKTSPVKTILYEILREYGFTAHQTEQALNLLGSETGKYISSPTHKLIKNRGWLIIAPINPDQANHIIIEETDQVIPFQEGVLIFKNYEFNPQTVIQKSPGVIQMDSSKLVYPLILRKWRQGDYFYPFGMQKKLSGKPGKKKLSKFFIDQKISLAEKERVWVIESNKKIVWIIHKRLDDRFKITPQTTYCTEIMFTSS